MPKGPPIDPHSRRSLAKRKAELAAARDLLDRLRHAIPGQTRRRKAELKCNDCGDRKPRDAFPYKSVTSPYRASVCRDCKRAHNPFKRQ